MNDKVSQISFESIVNWIFSEYKKSETVFGIPKQRFCINSFRNTTEIFDEKVSSVIGSSPGLTSGLAQNIFTNYLAGSRVFELRIVQKITGEQNENTYFSVLDENYNNVISTDFTIKHALEEFIKAHFLISIFSKEFELASEKDFIFNMSVGYNRDSIMSDEINYFIDSMKDCSNTKLYNEILDIVHNNIYKFENISETFLRNITKKVSNSITVYLSKDSSSDEIFEMVDYLLTQKKLHTYIKCNPTVLDYSFIRHLLDEAEYFSISLDKQQFENDFEFDDIIGITKKIHEVAKISNLEFGIKVTNFLPIKTSNNKIKNDKMLLTGKPLFLVVFSLIKKINDVFNGELGISYSGGADFDNISDLVYCGIKPVTISTNALSPDVHEKYNQLSTLIKNSLYQKKIDTDSVNRIYNNMVRDVYPSNAPKRTDSTILEGIKLPLFDCFKSPCKDSGCPIGQQIPEYLKYVAMEEYIKALEVILIDNPLPAITGAICKSDCQKKCNRISIDESVEIRKAKKIASNIAQDDYVLEYIQKPLKTNKRVCIIGAGPSGISAGVFLRRNGVLVDIYEKSDKPFGVVSRIIPNFTMSKHVVNRDFRYAKEVGINFIFNTEIRDINKMRKEYDFVIVATGSWGHKSNYLFENSNVLSVFDFLEDFKENNSDFSLGEKVCVIGRKNYAIDCARAVKRVKGVEETTLIFDKVTDSLDAHDENLLKAIEEGVLFKYLLSPKSYEGKNLTLEKLEVLGIDKYGKQLFKTLNEEEVFEFDNIIVANDFISGIILFNSSISLDSENNPIVNRYNETNLENVYIIGDCKKGMQSVVDGIADAKVVTKSILSKLNIKSDFINVFNDSNKPMININSKTPISNSTGAIRCLECNKLCDICVKVCPNRANIILENNRVLHIDALCFGCGNCKTFCPYKEAPFKNKPTIFWDIGEFKKSSNKGFVQVSENEYLVRLYDGEEVCYKIGDDFDPNFKELINIVHNEYSYIRS